MVLILSGIHSNNRFSIHSRRSVTENEVSIPSVAKDRIKSQKSAAELEQSQSLSIHTVTHTTTNSTVYENQTSMYNQISALFPPKKWLLSLWLLYAPPVILAIVFQQIPVLRKLRTWINSSNHNTLSRVTVFNYSFIPQRSYIKLFCVSKKNYFKSHLKVMGV